MRLVFAKKMRVIKMSQGDVQKASIFEKAIEVTQALGNEGMSSEDEAVRTTFTRAGLKKKATVLVIRRQYWRAAVATKYVRMIDFYIDRGKKKGSGGYVRVRIKQDSESAAPSKLVRNMYDDEWIKTQKSMDNEFEETLEIQKSTFQMVDFDFNGFSPEEDRVPDEDDGNNVDVEVDEGNEDAEGEEYVEDTEMDG